MPQLNRAMTIARVNWRNSDASKPSCSPVKQYASVIIKDTVTITAKIKPRNVIISY